MKYDFIEIGTSDFRTLAQSTDGIGISIEPVRDYFNNLPDREGLIKINPAISDKESTGEMHYVKADYVDKKGLPQWLKGCNSLNAAHPSVVKFCFSRVISLNDLTGIQGINIMPLSSVFKDHDVTEVDFLKIDTEGHDCTIMVHLLLLEKLPLIHKIQFESNVLTDRKQWEEVIKLAASCGYTWNEVETRGQNDTILTLK